MTNIIKKTFASLFIASILSVTAFAANATGQMDSETQQWKYAELIASNPKLAESDSVWIIEYDSFKDGHVIHAFEGPMPVALTPVERKDGELDAPAPSDFSDPSSWVNLPQNRTVTWSGTWHGSDGSDWDVSVGWTNPAGGPDSWGISSFTASEIEGDFEDGEGPPTDPE